MSNTVVIGFWWFLNVIHPITTPQPFKHRKILPSLLVFQFGDSATGASHLSSFRSILSMLRHVVGYFPSDSGHQVSHVGKIACQTHLVETEELSMPCFRYLMSQAMYNMHQRLKLPFASICSRTNAAMPLTVLRTFTAFVVHSHNAELKGVACATVQEAKVGRIQPKLDSTFCCFKKHGALMHYTVWKFG